MIIFQRVNRKLMILITNNTNKTQSQVSIVREEALSIFGT